MTDLEQLEAEYVRELAALEEAAARWLETRAAGKNLQAIDAEVKERDRVTRRLERKIHKAKKRGKQ